MSRIYEPSPADIAIVGMSIRVPGARNVAEFWRNLESGTESIRSLSYEDLRAAGVSPVDLAKPNYVRAAAVLEDLKAFDAGFFGMSPKDAAIMDPQHRHFLECCWEAMEHSGHVPELFPGAIGLFGGCGMNAYFSYNLLTNRELMESTGLFLVRHTGNDKDFLCTRASYQFNLKGPSISVQTACSTSLVAVHLAAQSLLNGECDLALAGGVTIELPHGRGYLYEEGEILSHDGHCRAFDAQSTGTIFGSGAGVVVLRRMEDALRDDDHILAILRGSAINNDGSGKVGYLAPGLDGQAAVYAEAISVSGVSAESIGHIEAHGTGTRVGDPIEVEALSNAFRKFTQRKGFCALGSVKTNIGHLDTAAGVVGLIKTVEALRHKKIPPSLHFEAPNPLIDFAETPFYVNRSLQPWPEGPEPRRAGVSSLGVGGTNAHVILEEAPSRESQTESEGAWVLPISAKSEAALEGAADRLAATLSQPGLALADAAFTLQYGRSRFVRRRVVVGRSTAEAAAFLTQRDSLRVVSGIASKDPQVAFLFPGGGSQYPNMGKTLYQSNALYREVVDQGLADFQAITGEDLRRWLLPSPVEAEVASRQLQRPLLGLAALFVTQYATARVWLAAGVQPGAVLGHSAGAMAAACVAGVTTAREGLTTMIARGQLFETLPQGAMLSVAMSESELAPLLGRRLSLAAVNTPELTVASGPVADIEALEEALRQRGIDAHRVNIEVAAHSQMLDPILDSFRGAVEKIALKKAHIPFASCSRGTWVAAEEVAGSGFWVEELRRTVRFSDAVRTVIDAGFSVLIEQGPGQTLGSLAREQPSFSTTQDTISSLPGFSKSSHDDELWFLTSAGRAWTRGVDLDWKSLHQQRRGRRVELPTYSWDHKDYWIEPGTASIEAPVAADPASVFRKQPDMSDWFYRPVWRRAAGQTSGSLAGSGPWWILGDDSDFATALESTLQSQGEAVAVVNPGQKADYETLLGALEKQGRLPRRIVHLGSKREDSFEGLLHLVQALAEAGIPSNTQLVVVTERLHPVEGAATAHPIQALSLGPVRVAPQEIPELNCLAIDLDRWDASVARSLLTAIVSSKATSSICAIRGGERWVESYEPLALPHTDALVLRERGVYVITGGQGGIGLTLARQFAASGKKPKLVLVGRSKMAADDARRAILPEIERDGAEVLLLEADVADARQTAEALATVNERWGPIHGVLHAAGVIDDGPLLSKTPEAARAVLRPKVEGTRVLAELLPPEHLDFMILFSSTSAILGLPGQIDYAAANAFLGAFAQSRPGVRVIDWGMWASTGMTRQLDGAAQVLRFDSRNDWVLRDHRVVGGPAVLPGSGYIGLARRALLGDSQQGGFRISNLVFLSPLVAPDNVDIAVRVALDEGSLSVSSEVHGQSREHATAEVSLLAEEPRRQHDLLHLQERCDRRQYLWPETRSLTRQGDYIAFGERWDVIRAAYFGDGEALLDLQLPAAFHSDTLAEPAHAALLDWATSGGLPMAPGYEREPKLHVPMSVAEILIHQPIPPRIFSHLRLVSGGSGSYDTVVFDVTLTDEDGWEIGKISGFTLRRIEKSLGFLPVSAPAPVTSEPPVLEAIREAAMLPEEAVSVFRRVFAASAQVRTIVSPLSLNGLLERLQPKREATQFERSQLPEDAVERWLVETCQELLGVAAVRPEDDFFALGGHSLVAVRLFLRIRKKFELELGMSTLFEARPLSKLAALIRAKIERSDAAVQDSPQTWSSVVRIQSGKPAKPTLFLIHGVGGNVVGFEPLVRRLGPDYPVCAIQCVGIDGKLMPLTRVEDMATRYIADIRAMLPHGPYHLIGYSFGGMIAFEMAQQLAAQGEPAAFVGMMDTWQHAWLPWHRRRTLAARILRHGKRVLFGPNRFKYLTEHLSLLQRFNSAKLDMETGAAQSIPQDLFHIVNSRAAFDYVPKPYPGEVTLFRAIERDKEDPYPYHLGWEGLAKGGLKIYEVAGSHLSMGEEPHVESLKRTIEACLASKH